MGAAIIELSSRCSGRADSANDFIAEFDHYSTAEEHDVW